MEQIKNLINSMSQGKIGNIIIALAIAIVFKILSMPLANIIIKIFKIDKKEKSKLSAFYKPLKAFFSLSGIYIAIMYLKQKFTISETILQIVNTTYRISLILVISNGFIQGLTAKSKLMKKLQCKLYDTQEENSSSMEFLIKILRAIIYVIAGFLIIQELGFDLKGLIAGLGIGGVIITLAAQDTAKNLLGGVVIFLDKPFKVGDYIEFGTYSGTVEDLTFRSTAIRTLDGSLVRVPNSEISSVAITNWNEINKRRYKTNLLLTLKTPLLKVEKVKQEIINMLLNDEEILEDSIMVNFENILNSGIELVIIANTNVIAYGEYLKVKEKLNYKIMKIIEENKVELAYNTQTIYVKN